MQRGILKHIKKPELYRPSFDDDTWYLEHDIVYCKKGDLIVHGFILAKLLFLKIIIQFTSNKKGRYGKVKTTIGSKKKNP